jgi:hypothetical protein
MLAMGTVGRGVPAQSAIIAQTAKQTPAPAGTEDLMVRRVLSSILDDSIDRNGRSLHSLHVPKSP